MKMKMSVTVGDKKYHLRRLHPKLTESITWEVLSEDEKIRIGIVAKYNSPWIVRNFGWRSYPEKYWLFHMFWPRKVLSGKTMKEALQQR
jgi:hypothetical protein